MPRPKNSCFDELQFHLIKLENNKYCALCSICKKTLANTAGSRLKAHRRVCKIKGNVNDIRQIDLGNHPNSNVSIPNSIAQSKNSEQCVLLNEYRSNEAGYKILLPNDMENYIKFSMVKSKIVMKEDAIPHKFQWLSDNKHNTIVNEKILKKDVNETEESVFEASDEEIEDSDLNESVNYSTKTKSNLILPDPLNLNPRIKPSQSIEEPIKIHQPFQGKRIIDFLYLFQQFKDVAIHDIDEGCDATFLHPISENLNGFYSKMTLHCSNCNKCFLISLNPFSCDSNLNRTFMNALDETGLNFLPTKKLFERLGVPTWSESKYYEEKSKVIAKVFVQEPSWSESNYNEEKRKVIAKVFVQEPYIDNKEIDEIIEQNSNTNNGTIPGNSAGNQVLISLLNNHPTPEITPSKSQYKVAIPRLKKRNIIETKVTKENSPSIKIAIPRLKPKPFPLDLIQSTSQINSKEESNIFINNFNDQSLNMQTRKRSFDDFVDECSKQHKKVCDEIVKEENIVYVKEELCFDDT